jgi:hypothetical protein
MHICVVIQYKTEDAYLCFGLDTFVNEYMLSLYFVHCFRCYLHIVHIAPLVFLLRLPFESILVLLVQPAPMIMFLITTLSIRKTMKVSQKIYFLEKC